MSLDILSDFDVGWLSGMLDGEGCVTITRAHWNNQLRYSPVIEISSTDKEVLSEIAKMTSIGHIYAIRQTSTTYGRKTVYEWRVVKILDIVTLLIKLLPHLRIKKLQSVLMIKYCVVKLEKDCILSLAERSKPLYEKMRLLNQRKPIE